MEKMYSYKIYKKGKKRKKRRYTREELLEMTTYQLKNICFDEKIIKGLESTLDREKLISTILKYRGVEESLLIDDFSKEGFGRIQNILDDNLNLSLDSSEIRIPAKITIYHEIGIDKEDMYKVMSNEDLGESNVFLINGKNYLCGIFNIIKETANKNSYYLKAKAENLAIADLKNKNYKLLFFKKQESEYLYKSYYSKKILPPQKLECYSVDIIDLEIRNLEESKSILCIDFGTTNTTAGAYLDRNYVSEICHNDTLNNRILLNDINYVKYLDNTDKQEKWIEIVPTTVVVQNCRDKSNISYMFGYDAKKYLQKNDYAIRSSVFQGIKRWVNNYNEEIEIYDERGNAARVKKGEIIRAYIKYIINSAEHQFKCKFKNIHISSPVKLKSKYIEMFQNIIYDYNVEAEDVLDEGISVLYNTIANQIEKRKFYDGEEYKALVIDCGGGTTDLSSCSFKIEEGDISYKVDISTTFENGDTNFGGNNITFRIMQFMKIIFANHYTSKEKNIDIDFLIPVPSTDIFRIVDESGVEEVYTKFQEYYDMAENIIPTKFKKYENKISEEYQMVKNNFYFLWEIAENMKKEFFQKTNILRNKFDSLELEDRENDLHITQLNKWGLSVIQNDRLGSVSSFPNVVFNIKEINKLIKADIYNVVRKFLEKFYESRELTEYSIIKLTGQSCKIDTFKEALKEFVPGKSIEFKQKKEGDENSLDLKLSCLRGVLRYINAKKMGDIEVSIKNNIPIVPYSVSAFTYNSREVTLLESQEKISKIRGNISKPITTEEIKFYLKSNEGELQKEYRYYNREKDYKKTSVDDIVLKYSEKIMQEDTDTIRNGEIKFFLFASENSWGFQVLPICRKEEQLYIGKKQYFAFDDELTELDFFDGYQ